MNLQFGTTALMHAASKAQIKCMRLLMESGAALEIQNCVCTLELKYSTERSFHVDVSIQLRFQCILAECEIQLQNEFFRQLLAMKVLSF